MIDEKKNNIDERNEEEKIKKFLENAPHLALFIPPNGYYKGDWSEGIEIYDNRIKKYIGKFVKKIKLFLMIILLLQY